MTDALFLSNNSVTYETNHVKFETHTQGSWANKRLRNVEIGQTIRHCVATLYQKVEILPHLGAAFPPPCTDWREILYGQANPRAPWSYQISPESVQRVAPAGRKC